MEGALHEYKEHVGVCASCGNSPVNHFTTHLAHSFAVWSSPGKNKQRAFRRWFEARVSALVPLVDRAVYASFAALPITRFSGEVSGAVTYRSQVIWEEAVRRGIAMEQMHLLGRATEVYRAKLGERWTYFQSLPIPAHLDLVDGGWIDDKLALKEALAHAGVPVPRAVSVTTLVEAQRALAEMQGPIVVKPRAGSRGRHTTVKISTCPDLVRAFKSAKQLCHYVAIEEYLTGSVCRGTVVGGKIGRAHV